MKGWKKDIRGGRYKGMTKKQLTIELARVNHYYLKR